MTLEQAIKELTEDTNHPTAQFTPHLLDAEKLLIEAGKCILKLRTFEYFGYPTDLPGETKD